MFRCGGCGAFQTNGPTYAGTCERCGLPLDGDGTPQDVTGEQLSQAVRSSPVPVLLEVWAPWCAQSRVALPILDQVARERRGDVAVLRLNTDVDPAAADDLHVTGMPTFILFREGLERARHAGVMRKAELVRWLSERGNDP